MSDCPETKRDIEQGTGICFKCGSTEHSASRCSVKLPPGLNIFYQHKEVKKIKNI